MSRTAPSAPREGDKFALGNIVRITKDGAERLSADAGALAVVIGYQEGSAGRYSYPPTPRYLSVLWLTASAKGQSNGGYEEKDFELHKEDFRDWRPDMAVEDRSLVEGSWAHDAALTRLSNALLLARAGGHKIKATLIKEVTTVEETEL